MGSASGRNRTVLFLSELRRFLRAETGVFMVCISLSGYLIFNALDARMVFPALAVFFATSATYAYNHYTDKEEDGVNNRGVNRFAAGSRGYCIIAACTAISLLSAARLSQASFAIYLISLVAGFAYSAFRIKRFFIIKNLYSGVFLSAPFLIGAAAGSALSAAMIPYFILISVIGFTSNLIGDVRGCEGDRLAGLKTIPVMAGIGTSKAIVHLNLWTVSFISIALGYFMLVPIIPSLAAVSFFVGRDDHRKARSSMISTFLVLLSFLVLMSFWEVSGDVLHNV
jgi:4-hydroxybenzoate polyprenyltransferase